MLLSKKGTFLDKKKEKKLDYKKVQSGYEIKVSEAIIGGKFKKINKYQIILNEESLINYLYAERYIGKIND